MDPGPTRVSLAGNVRVRARVVASSLDRLTKRQATILDHAKETDRIDTAGMLAELDSVGLVELTDWLFLRRLPAEADAALKRLQYGKSEA